MRPAAEGLGRPPPRVVYTDLDGTLVGPGGSLFATEDGGVSAGATRALASLHDAGIALVPVSGRTVPQVRETARLLGARDFIAELGGVTCYDLGEEMVRDPASFGRGGTPFQAMAWSGAAGLLLDAHPGMLEPHAPWAFEGHEVGMLLRGHLDPREAVDLLERSGYGWVELQDNGILSRPFPTLRTDEVHVYHLVPRGVSKAAAVAADLNRRGLGADQSVAVGDSPSDASLAPLVGAVFIVANGLRTLRGVEVSSNVFLTQRSFGDGFAEVIEGLLRGGTAA